jgi:hypothetical protein
MTARRLFFFTMLVIAVALLFFIPEKASTFQAVLAGSNFGIALMNFLHS